MKRPNSLKELIQSIVLKQMPEVVPAKVTKTEPIEIMLTNDDTTVSEASLIIPGSKLPLKKGETLYLLSIGRIYYLLDRM